MISDFKAGSKVCQPVMLRLLKIGNSSNGKSFARGLVEDSSGSMPFICFEGEIVDKLRDLDGTAGFMMAANVDVNKFDASLQVVIHKLHDLMPEDDISNLLPCGNFNVEEYKTKLATLIKSVKSPMYRSLLENILSGATYDAFVKNPAGMKMHHAYLGGLLQHSVDVASLALAMANEIKNVDKDLVITGALLHDLGKIREISAGIGFPYTGEGRLMGHIALSCMMVQEAANALHIPSTRLDTLMHVLLSHHGENEKGSPVACATREAFIVHYADEMNAVMNQFEESAASGKSGWEFKKMLGRNIFIA